MANYEIVEFIAIMQHLIDKFTFSPPPPKKKKKKLKENMGYTLFLISKQGFDF